VPQPAVEAQWAALRAFGREMEQLGGEESLWQTSANTGEGLRSATFYAQFRRYLRDAGLPLSSLHILRHSAAKLRRDAGESVEGVGSWSTPSWRWAPLTFVALGDRRIKVGARGGGDRDVATGGSGLS
jgi:hypothetical protein